MMRAVSLALLLAAAPAQAAKYNFDYATAGAESVGLVRTFDDGINTVLAFDRPVASTRPTITTSDGTILEYKAINRYAVLPGLQRQVLIYTRGLVAQVRHVPNTPAIFSATVMPPTAALDAPLPRSGVAVAAAPASVFQTVMPPTAAPGALPSRSGVAVAAAPAAPLLQTVMPPPAAPSALPSRSGVAVAAAPATPSPTTASRSSPPLTLTSAADPSPPAATDAPAPAPSKAETVISVHSNDEPAALTPEPTWVADSATSLRTAIENWSKRAGWSVVWDAGIDYPLAGTLRYSGTYLDAVRGIFKAHAKADQPLQVDVYTRQQLIHITE